ncbi:MULTISPECIES: CPBP family intramembrane glutamic endopeptidase [Haloferax]|uniref:CPBP family intramembrane metalloprotease n=1 Tax=Haloferax marinum TaxID=2666143 RepID=A0A6A8G7Z5_9EURY|nr:MULTISPECIES: type II CAAX endopeptidase family protein [Haloferax]KAB1198071.1 CPBP family intramembrane metalloprotease [Haloferax sp. CBA1150]MRW97141.1 CPBP family intramembrane metalloprotease [Haloferax marinum]
MAHDSAHSTASPGDHLQAYGGIIIVVALSLIIGALFGSIAGGIASGFVPATDPLVDAIASAAQFVGFGVVGLGYLASRDDWDIVRLETPSKRDIVWIAGGLGALLVVYLGATALMNVLGIQSGESVLAQQGQENPVYFLYLTVVTILLVGPTEELVFRGIAYGELRRLWGPAPAVVLSSAVFASIHLWSFSGEGMFISLAMVFVLGSVLAVIYEKSGNLVVAAVAHGLFNAVQFLASYAQATGLF